ncbi:hypothetical protein [Microbacterium indicum]|uniref:hypothetical protein n=1 Tax=Microbacterium indicum TaxID=358100 RepID=UPI0003FC40FA|nr:hypothetical protein [Microbacterium indicum]
MQLGTRWASGSEPPRSVPEALRAAVAEVEASGAAGHWTLTWLEGRPIAELDAGWELSLQADGSVATERF